MEITLNSNEGISQAILRELKNEGVLTSNMDKEAWTNIFDEFKNDQESKINETKVGEAWNDFYKNYNTEKNDKLTIAEATWNKIKEFAEAFKKRKGEQTETTVQDTEADTNVDNSAASDVKNNTASKKEITKDDCKPTKCASIFYHKATDTYYKEVNGKLEQLKPHYNDTHIVDILEDGSWWEASNESWEWTRKRSLGQEKHDAISECHIKDGREIEKYTYDARTQQPLEEGDFKDPNKSLWYEYDDKGNKIKTFTFTDHIPIFGSTDYMYKEEKHKTGKTVITRYDKDDYEKYNCTSSGAKKVKVRDVVEAESPAELSNLFAIPKPEQPYGLPKVQPASRAPLKRGF